MHNRSLLPWALFPVLLAALDSHVAAQCETHKFMASDSSKFSTYGNAIAGFGERLVVGSKSEDSQGANAGAAYVYERGVSGWVEVAKLTASNAAPGDQFGDAVAMSADTILVGAEFADTAQGVDSGSVYVFERIGGVWQETDLLLAAGVQAGDTFGDTLAISGDLAVLSAEGDDSAAGGAGAVYVYERSGGVWGQVDKLISPTPSAGDAFGHACWISGTRIVVGAQADDDQGSNSGAAFIFERSGATWVFDAQLLAAGVGAGDRLGREVNLDGDLVVIGAEGDDDQGMDAGAAYLFEKSGGTWTEVAKLTASDGGAGALFGHAVGVGGGQVAVGAYFHAHSAVQDGAVYVYSKVGGNWSEVFEWTASDAAGGDVFGRAVSLFSGNLAAGSPLNSGNATGAAYALALLQPLGSLYCTANPNSVGSGALISAGGSPWITDDCVVFAVTDLPPNQAGYFLMAKTQTDQPLGNSQGRLCVGPGGIVRFSGNVGSTGAAGTFDFQPDLEALPQGTVFAPGETWNFQLWYRDKNPGTTSNTSAGLSVVFQ
jgi:FG-GAP repeat